MVNAEPCWSTALGRGYPVRNCIDCLCTAQGWDVKVFLGLDLLFGSFWTHRALIARLAAREISQRFKGSILGLGWAVLTPLLTAAVFTFVFSGVFQMRWSGRSGSPYDFALMLLVGLMIHGLFAEAISRAPSLIIGNASYVTKVVFPLEILPVVVAVASLVNAGITAAILLVGNLLVNGTVQWTSLFFPIVLAPFVIFVTALVMLAAACGVFLRDLAQVTGLVITMALFLTPVFYPLDAVPAAFQFYMRLNPLTSIVEQSRSVLLLGIMPNFVSLALYGACALLCLAFSFWVFRRLRGGFADVL